MFEDFRFRFAWFPFCPDLGGLLIWVICLLFVALVGLGCGDCVRLGFGILYNFGFEMRLVVLDVDSFAVLCNGCLG